MSLPLDLVSPVERLVDDLGGMSAVALLGFSGASAEQTSAALRELAADRRWAYADLRDPSANANLDAPVLVVATGKAKVAVALATRIRELVEKRPGLRQKLVIVCESASRHTDLPIELARVPYSEYLPLP